MGRTPKPLTILVHPDLAEWSEWSDLAAQGHTVHFTLHPEQDYLASDIDLILAPNAHRMDENLRKYLPLAIQAARSRRYGPKKEDKGPMKPVREE